MNRVEFMQTCGLVCLGATSMGMLLQSCVSVRNITADIKDEHLIVPRSSFVNKEKPINYIIATNKNLQFPVYVFQFSESDYSALYLRCSHQGNELNAYGDKLVCSAHGSEFNNKGEATNGPATDPLRSFHVRIDNHNILISLRKT